MREGSKEDFLRMGGIPQGRYELLRSRWFALDCGGVLGLARMPLGQRLIHFGLLGMLDEDLTGGAWFGASSAMSPSGVRCTRVLLAADDGEVRACEAYRCILGLMCNTSIEAAEGFG